MARMNEMGGDASTFATVRYWNEAMFRYLDVVYVTKNSDARAAYVEMHKPPLVIVESVRYDNEPAILPATGVAAWSRPHRPWSMNQRAG